MEDKINLILDSEFPKLIPYELLDEYLVFANEKLKNTLRANCLRIYLEGIIDLFIKDIVIKEANITKEQWNEKDLFEHVNLIDEYYAKGFKNKFHRLRKIGNKGSHYGGNPSDSEIRDGLKIVQTLVEDIFVRYFIKHPLGSENEVMTILSALPPRSRIYILSVLWKNNKSNIDIIDKLSMAYLKNGDKDGSIKFLNDLLDNNYITKQYHTIFLQKINNLSKYLGHFDISRNIMDTKRIFQLLCTDNVINEYQEFINIFSILIKGYDTINTDLSMI